MLTSRAAVLPLVFTGLTALLATGCESMPHQGPYAAIETGFCGPAEEAEDECIQPLDMTVDVHE
jgi:hypothetical protein